MTWLHSGFKFQTADTRPRSRGTTCPRLAFRCPSKKEGAGNAGCTLHPRSRVQRVERKLHTSIQGSGGNPTFPAQWLYGLLRALLGDRAFLPPSLANESANLTPASGRRDHTTSPYASAPFVKSASTSTASHPNVRDDGQRPFSRRQDAGSPKGDLPDDESETLPDGLFCRRGGAAGRLG